MSDREALAAHLGRWSDSPKDPRPVIKAARERLALMAETCGTCGGPGQVHTGCTVCHDTRLVYPPALVERIAEVLRQSWTPDSDFVDDAVAVLDAINDWKPIR